MYRQAKAALSAAEKKERAVNMAHEVALLRAAYGLGPAAVLDKPTTPPKRDSGVRCRCCDQGKEKRFFCPACNPYAGS